MIGNVYRLLKTVEEKKSVGRDKFLNKLLKMAQNMISSSLTEIFAKSNFTGLFPNDWKEAKIIASS